MSDTAYDRAIAYAAERGRQDGDNAAGWYVQDTIGSRVSRDARPDAAALLAGIGDGDPYIMDTLPHADLSGEYVDTLTGPALVADALAAAGLTRVDVPRDALTGDPDVTITAAQEWFTDICDAYEQAFATAAEDTIAAACRAMLED